MTYEVTLGQLLFEQCKTQPTRPLAFQSASKHCKTHLQEWIPTQRIFSTSLKRPQMTSQSIEIQEWKGFTFPNSRDEPTPVGSNRSWTWFLWRKTPLLAYVQQV